MPKQPTRPLEPEVRRVGQDHTSSDFEPTSIPGWERRGDLWVDLAAPEHRPVTTSVALARNRKDREGNAEAKPASRAHDYLTGEECSKTHGDAICPICDGGLRLCKVCNGAEGSLASECSGRFVSESEQDAIMASELDFVGGRWVAGRARKTAEANPQSGAARRRWAR